MPTKIRLQRHGKKKSSFFHIVIADGRAPRDGKFIEKIGTYNPNTNPATIDLQFDKALNWLKKGAQPTDTTKAILSYEGVIYKNHLDGGVVKGAFTQEAADKKFEAWKADKMNKIQSKTESVIKETAEEAKKRMAHEAEVNKKRAQEIAAKQAEAHAAATAETAAPEAPAAETEAEAQAAEAPAATEEVAAPAEEAKEEAPAAEEKVEEKEEKKEEVKAEEKQEEVKAEAKEEKAEEAEEEKKSE